VGAARARLGPRHVRALIATLLGCAALMASVDAAPIDSGAALRDSQAAIGRQLPDAMLVDQHGRPLRLASLRGRPLVLNFVYTSCAFVCPTLTMHLKDVVRVGREALGEASFNVLTIGFDTRVDTPERMAQFARARGIDMPGWHFASADAATIAQLATQTGFRFAPSAGGFDHLAQVTVIDAGGRIYRQVYGPDFEPPLLIDPLKSLLLGASNAQPRAGGWLKTVRLLCTAYDPRSGRYRFDYSLVVEIVIGLMCTVAVGLFIIRAWGQARPGPTP
jgi:protein SCO1/2